MKKHIYRILMLNCATLMAVSCADEGILAPETTIEKPDNAEQQEVLNGYDVLKSYIGENSNLKLGLAMSASRFMAKKADYSLACANFNSITPENEMKYGGIVADNGEMNFNNLTPFVKMAHEAGLEVYGHAICWHSQQNKTYLESLIAPTITPSDNPGKGYCIVMNNTSAHSNNWEAQTWYRLPSKMDHTANYTLSFMIKADQDVDLQIFLQNSGGDEQQYPEGFKATQTWQKVERTFTPNYNGSNANNEDKYDKITFNYGTYVGNVYVDNISLVKDGENTNLIENSDFEGGNINGWNGQGGTQYLSENGAGYDDNSSDKWEPSVIANGTFDVIDGWSAWGNNFTAPSISLENGALKISTTATSSENWHAQVGYSFPVIKQGTYRLSMRVKGDAGKFQANVQDANYSGIGYNDITVTPAWTEFSAEFENNKDIVQFVMSFGTYQGIVYLDDITLCRLNPNSGNIIIEKTDEEKKAAISQELERWTAGVLNACRENPDADTPEGKGELLVKSWDVVNEPISDDAPYNLKSVSDSNHKDEYFYWQQYLGNDDFARLAVKYARQYGSDDMLLFVNDYNLELPADDNGKCKSLVAKIKEWEADGVTKIDGIGTQMHVTCSLNPSEQEANKAGVTRMFEILAESGKLIRIAEIDMGIKDADGKYLWQDAVNYDQLKAMADYYEFIISEYFRIIPEAQQFGITHWSPVDPSTDEGVWRRGEPVGLWNRDYERKPAYEGFIKGIESMNKNK